MWDTYFEYTIMKMTLEDYFVFHLKLFTMKFVLINSCKSYKEKNNCVFLEEKPTRKHYFI